MISVFVLFRDIAIDLDISGLYLIIFCNFLYDVLILRRLVSSAKWYT